jgi:hypothetical protein
MKNLFGLEDLNVTRRRVVGGTRGSLVSLVRYHSCDENLLEDFLHLTCTLHRMQDRGRRLQQMIWHCKSLSLLEDNDTYI